MKTKMTWFWTWEKKIWGDKINANQYFATLSILFVAMIGASVGGGKIFHEWFGWNTDTNLVAIGALLILLWGYNIAESIVASETAMIALWRSLLVMTCILMAFTIGVIASVVVILLVTLWLVLMLIASLLSGSGHSSSGSRSSGALDGVEQYGYDENGSQYTMRDVGGGYARDDNGRRWKNEGGSKWRLDE